MSKLRAALLHVVVMGKGEDGKPWRPLCPGAVSDPVPKLAVLLVKSSPVDLTLPFMLTGFPFV